MKVALKILPFILLGIGSQALSAQEKSTLTLEEIVVTGTKSQKSLKEGPVKTDLLSEQVIKENHYKDIAEAIAEIPGVTLNSNDGKLGQSAIIQGLSREHVLVLIDGSPVLQNSISGFDLSQISTNGVRQIEVVKGGASALYGGQAIGGVINIITKKPQNKLLYDLEIGRDQVSGDNKTEHGYNAAKVLLSGKTNQTGLKLQLSHNQSSSVERDSSSVSRDTPDISKFNGNLSVEREFNSRHSLKFEYNRYQEKNTSYQAKLLAAQSIYEPVETIGDIKGDRIRLSQHSTFDSFTITTSLLCEKIHDELIMAHNPKNDYIESLKTSDLKRMRAETQIDFTLFTDHFTTLGLVTDKNYLDQENANATGPGSTQYSKDIDEKSSANYDVYLQDDWIVGQYELISGVRYTHDESFGGNLSPKLNLSYSPNLLEHATTVIRASYGSGFRSPNLKERFYYLDHRSFGYIVKGNDNLKPEKSHSFQFGFEVAQKNIFGFHANLFFNNVNELITTEQITGPTNDITYQYMNINQAKIRGYELAGNYSFLSNYNVAQSFTFTKAEDARTGLVLTNRPYYVAQTNFRYLSNNQKISAVYNLKYFGDSYATTDNTEKFAKYMQSDLKLNYEFLKNTDVFIGIKNLFNVKKSPIQDSPNPVYDQRPSLGRMLFVGLRIEG